MKPPFFSVITATLNRRDFLAEAIASVAAQDTGDCEHLILDGGSTDGTLEMLREHPRLRVVSEPDRGMYDAWNRGLRLAQGEVVAFVNSDDIFLPGACEAVHNVFADPAVQVVTGGAEFFRSESGSRTVVRTYDRQDRLALNVRNVTFGVPVINARFFRRTFLAQIGELDLRYAVAADRELLLRAALQRPREIVLDRAVYGYREHADSQTIRAYVPATARFRQEHLDIAERYLEAPHVPAEDRETLRQWHAQESAMLFFGHLLEASPGSACRAASRGWRVSPSWPVAAARLATSALARRVSPER